LSCLSSSTLLTNSCPTCSLILSLLTRSLFVFPPFSYNTSFLYLLSY
jgi:hypothetical protein